MPTRRRLTYNVMQRQCHCRPACRGELFRCFHCRGWCCADTDLAAIYHCPAIIGEYYAEEAGWMHEHPWCFECVEFRVGPGGLPGADGEPRQYGHDCPECARDQCRFCDKWEIGHPRDSCTQSGCCDCECPRDAIDWYYEMSPPCSCVPEHAPGCSHSAYGTGAGDFAHYGFAELLH